MPNHADIALTGARIHTVNPSAPWADALAIRDGRLVAVGSAADISEFIGPRTTVYDLPGKLVLPGFQDAHVHPPIAGIDRMRCNLLEVDGREATFAAVRAYAESHPDVPWILGAGWALSDFPGGIPTAAELDALVPDRPAFIHNADGHGAWANTMAMELAGITRDTPDPDDGRIERDAGGDPVGMLQEGATSLVLRVAPTPGPAEVEQGILVAQAYLHALGITAWQDAIVGEPSWGDSLEIYRKLGGDGRLTARVIGSLWWFRDHDADEQFERLRTERAENAAGRFAPTSVKLMRDGVVENRTACVLDPYLDPVTGAPTDERGIDFLDPQALPGIVTRLDAAAFQCHFHAIGERAVRSCLDAVEAAQSANGRNNNRHHISHIQVVHPDDQGRFGSLGVGANAQALWACHDVGMDELNIPILGKERSTWMYPFGSLLRSGAPLAMGSDWSVSTPNPFLQMEVAVRRIGRDSPELPPLNPNEAITLEEAARAFTLGSAWVNHLDVDSGSLEVGKFADLCVADRDIFAGPSEEIGDAQVDLTMVEGEIVHASPGFS